MGLTAKQLIFSIASVVVGGGIVLLLYKYIGLTGSAYVAIPCVAPIALGGFYSFNGMSFYEYMGKKLYFMFANRALTYVSTEGEPTIKASGMGLIKCGSVVIPFDNQISKDTDLYRLYNTNIHEIIENSRLFHLSKP